MCRFFHAPMPRQSSPSPKQTLHLSLPSKDSHARHEHHALRQTIPRVAAQPAGCRGHHPPSGIVVPSLPPSCLHGFSTLCCCEWRRGPESLGLRLRHVGGWADGRGGEAMGLPAVPPMNWSVGWSVEVETGLFLVSPRMSSLGLVGSTKSPPLPSLAWGNGATGGAGPPSLRPERVSLHLSQFSSFYDSIAPFFAHLIASVARALIA